jgi:hypothetical protein
MPQEFKDIANNKGNPFVQYTSDNSKELSSNLANVSTITINSTRNVPVPETQRQPTQIDKW